MTTVQGITHPCTNKFIQQNPGISWGPRSLCSLCLYVGGQKLAKEYGALENGHEKTRDFFFLLTDSIMRSIIHHQLPEFTKTHVHWIGDAIQPSHPLSAPSPPAFNLSQHLFQWVCSLHLVAKVLGVSASASVLLMKIQDRFPLGWTGWISLQSKGLSG